MAAKPVTRKTLYLLVLYQICGIGIFIKGFFPLKRNSPGFSSVNANGSKVHRHFDRLIVIMIDALRADFVFGDKPLYMPFTQGLIKQGKTFSFTAHSHPPTVTMPRIKAITTGTIPGFIDVVLNVDSKELLEDNIITQMKMANLTINFFGDDTWIKLFPNHFKRSDGTTSFFVTDYTEVDNNVTRHLESEMTDSDWHVTILHYLGLDHIGHLAGPTSPLIQPKLHEMDNIIQMIHSTVVKQDKQRNISTLIVLCGDHGMTNGGSHGGSSKQETTTPLVFMSSLFQTGRARKGYDLQVNQIDIAPTLSVLIGLSIPKNSIGILVTDFLSGYSSKQRLEALRMNALQIFNVFRGNVNDDVVIELNQAMTSHNKWLMDYNNGTDSSTSLDSRAMKISQIYIIAMKIMTNQLSSTISSYDYYALYIGIWMLLQSLLGCLLNNFPYHTRCTTGILVFLLVSCFALCCHLHNCSTRHLGGSELFCNFSFLSVSLSAIIVLSTAFTLTILFLSLINLSTRAIVSRVLLYLHKPQREIFLVFGLFLHNISLLSSSFIEEEHQTWYFLTKTYHLSLFFSYLRDIVCNNQPNCRTNCEDTSGGYEGDIRHSLPDHSCDIKHFSHHKIIQDKDSSKKMIFVFLILLCCDRLLRCWNQTGIKWSDQPDLGDWFVKPENKPILSYLVFFTLLIITAKIYLETRNLLLLFLFSAGVFGVYIYRGVTGALNLPLRNNDILLHQSITLAQYVHFCVLCIMLLSIAQSLQASRQVKEDKLNHVTTVGEMFLVGYLLLILLLLRPHNIPLVALTLGQTYIHHHYIWKRCNSILEIVLSAYFLGWFTYFSQGNSNSLATVDIAAGYVGLQQDYPPIFVGILASLATFSGPLFWIINALVFITKQKNVNLSYKLTSRQFCVILFLVKTINVTVCAVMSWLNCYHLFVWSVFSPKMLYEGVICAVFDTFILIISIMY